ncbi:DUF4169 family protein [Sphingomonas sp. Mn802worker]|uniref:DUF4169 family protein n=1 Tax=Sphingomonas sp. Mn802worker TaxID=629773 RepID=UPI000381AC25|nr:DUF4169 family protein [Sphingomonas sp. Mn802worker]
MGVIVNLRLARKAKARGEAHATAATNRAAFGRTKAEKQRDAAVRNRIDATLDGARRDPD